MSIPGGMIYVGTACNPRPGATTRTDRSLKAYSQSGIIGTHKWATGRVTARFRRARAVLYLKWLAEGRQAPDADIGFVFLFFYGLERRVIVDSQQTAPCASTGAAIAAEVRRLLSIYGESSNSFRRYAGELLDWMLIADHPARLYYGPFRISRRRRNRRCSCVWPLVSARFDGVPVPGPLALAWVQCDPRVGLRTAATRCKSQFEALFQERYTATFGDGLCFRVTGRN